MMLWSVSEEVYGCDKNNNFGQEKQLRNCSMVTSLDWRVEWNQLEESSLYICYSKVKSTKIMIHEMLLT